MLGIQESSATACHRSSGELFRSPRLLELSLRFGLDPAGPTPRPPAFDEIEVGCFPPGSLTLVLGPSGSGKTSLLARIGRQFPTSRLVHQVPFPLDVAVIDAIAPTAPLAEAASVLTSCGLAEPALWARTFAHLSDGERLRARLARAIAQHRAERTEAPLLCDEFTSGLHRRLAYSIAFNLRKLVSRERFALVVASSVDDILPDLRPDRLVRLRHCFETPVFNACAYVARRPPSRPRASIAGRLRIERGHLSDYAELASLHYRQGGPVGFVDDVFVLRERASRERLGVVVYGRNVLELAIRNRVTGRRFVRRPQLLNAEMRVLKRLIVHPDVRGCGLGHWLIERTLPRVGTRFVECLSAMGVVHPVFERAGMRWMGVCEPPAHRDEVLTRLRAEGADPFGADFVSQVCRRPAVRRLVARAVFDWYRSTGGGSARVVRQSPADLARTYRQLAGSRPAYFIWASDASGWEQIERGQACGVPVG